MSKYRRDDKTFRDTIRMLAGAGLRFPTNPDPIVTVTVDMAKLEGQTIATLKAHGFRTNDYPTGAQCSMFRARPCNECGEPANLGGVPAYVRVIEPSRRTKELSESYVTKKFNASGIIAGLIYGVLVGAVVGIVIGIAVSMRGAH